MLYKITQIEQITLSTGTLKGVASLVDISGNELTNITMWPKSWKNFAILKIGDEVDGDVITQQKGKYTNNTLFPPSKPKTTQQDGAYRGSQTGLKAAQERKADNIDKAQEKKEESIKTASTFSSATLITLEFYKRSEKDFPMSEVEFNKKWLEVRAWLLAHWSTANDNSPF